ncbi:MAG: class I SAM-dependent methyltransferase [Pseudomonadales bacterium]|nr:class I SAM-dependent methyltransferase [Pseudomonadales bacterium]
MFLLHVAPEACLAPVLREWATGGYLTADLVRTDVSVRFDILACPLPSSSMDAIYCSHVLQDVVDDGRALSECFRVLKPGGWAILNVPVKTTETVEHPDSPGTRRSSTDTRIPEHLRTYGKDYARKLSVAGFEVHPTASQEVLERWEDCSCALNGPAAGTVFFVRKPRESQSV